MTTGNKGAKQVDIWTDYEAEVAMLERQGVCRSDAQSVVDVEFERRYGLGWERKAGGR